MVTDRNARYRLKACRCLQNWQPIVNNTGSQSYHWYINGGTLNGIWYTNGAIRLYLVTLVWYSTGHDIKCEASFLFDWENFTFS